jgi:thiol-disulfide isomerase/thioredoxin
MHFATRLSLLLCCALVACGRGAPPTQSTAAKPAPVAAPAAAPAAAPRDVAHPRLQVTTFDGQPWDLAMQRGHWVVVNFWATWCGPCLKEMPALSAFGKQRADVSVIGLDYEEIEKADMAAFLKQHAPSYPVALLDVYHPPQDFDAPRGLPMSYLIAPDGSVAKKFIGPLTIKELEQAIAAAKPVH